jgi:hypothetical protein
VRAEVARSGSPAGAAGEPLHDVRDHHGAPRGLPQDARGVHPSRVPAPAPAQIDAASVSREAGGDVGGRYGAEEVPGCRCEQEANDRHWRRTRMMRPRALVGVMGFGILLWALVVRGALTLDLGVGRRYRPLGPLRFRIAAPREVVFDVIAGPYRRTPRALEAKLQVLERGEDFVLAAHHTRAYGLIATTVETVRFERPERVHFRLVRGPVPHVVEQFVLHETPEGTELEYRGELGTDLWALGSAWGAAVARTWEATVESSLRDVTEEAERQARRG